jgi:hypothetical protein
VIPLVENISAVAKYLFGKRSTNQNRETKEDKQWTHKFTWFGVSLRPRAKEEQIHYEEDKLQKL